MNGWARLGQEIITSSLHALSPPFPREHGIAREIKHSVFSVYDYSRIVSRTTSRKTFKSPISI